MYTKKLHGRVEKVPEKNYSQKHQEMIDKFLRYAQKFHAKYIIFYGDQIKEPSCALAYTHSEMERYKEELLENGYTVIAISNVH